MTTLREAATAALEALVRASSYYDTYAEIEALRAALAEEALQRLTDVSQEIEAALGCEHCNQPLYAAVKCRVCGRVAEPTTEDSSAVEPVAWMHTDPDNYRVKFLVWRENEPAYRGVWIKTPLFTAPSQRLPLTEEEIHSLFRTAGSPTAFARAIEAKHGITS